MSSQLSAQTTRKPGERLFCFLLVLGSVYLFWQAYNIAGFSALSSAGAFPMATAATMVLASCIVFVNTLKRPPVKGLTFFHHGLPPLVAIIMALILLYAVLLEELGFIVASFLFLFVSIQFLYRRSLLTSLSISVLSLLVVYVVFRLVFQIVLPEGIVPERDILASIKAFWR